MFLACSRASRNAAFSHTALNDTDVFEPLSYMLPSCPLLSLEGTVQTSVSIRLSSTTCLPIVCSNVFPDWYIILHPHPHHLSITLSSANHAGGNAVGKRVFLREHWESARPLSCFFWNQCTALRSGLKCQTNLLCNIFARYMWEVSLSGNFNYLGDETQQLPLRKLFKVY